jgi:replicative DNA helicase
MTPHNPDSERVILACLMQDSEVCDILIPKLTEEHFFTSLHQALFRTIRNLYESGKQPDLLTVRENSKIPAGEISEIYNRTTTGAVYAQYYNNLKESYKKRRLLALGREIEQNAGESDNVDELIDTIQERLHEVRDSKSPIYTPLELIREVEVETELPYKMGLYDLDKITGGLSKKELTIIAGRPSMGKTALGLTIGLNLAKAEAPVAFFSLEMGERSVGQRIISMLSGVELQKIRTNEDLSADEIERITNAKISFTSYPFKTLPESSPTIYDIRAEARKLNRKGECEIVIIDYLQYVKTSNLDSYVRELGEITREAKSMAKELDVPVVMLAQLSRTTEHRTDNRPRLADIRGSGEIEQDADVVIFAHRPHYYDSAKEERLAELIVAKNRNGRTGMTELIWNGDCVRYESMDWRKAKGE